MALYSLGLIKTWDRGLVFIYIISKIKPCDRIASNTGHPVIPNELELQLVCYLPSNKNQVHVLNENSYLMYLFLPSLSEIVPVAC